MSLVKLKDVVEFLDSKRKPVKAADRIEGPYPYYGANGQQGNINGYIFDEPLVLLAEDGGHFFQPERGIAYKVTGKTWVNNHAHVLRPKANLDVDYLCYSIKNLNIARQLTGSTRAKLTKKGAGEIKIPLPPLDEQKRIAGILDAADELRAKRRQTLLELDTLIQSTFLDLFGDPVINPKGWEVKPFEKVGHSRLGKMLDKKKQTGMHLKPYLANFNVQWGKFVTDDLREMDFTDADQIEFSLKRGDLLICEGGEVGRCAVWDNEDSGIFFQKALHRCRLNPEISVPHYAHYYFWFMANNGGFKDFISTSTISHLTGAKLKRLPYPLPPLALQQQFAEIVEKIEAQKSRCQAHLDELDTLFATLQSRAFKGEL